MKSAHTTPSAELILVIDDDDMLRMVARETLEAAGFRVEEAEDGATGLAAAAELRPAVVMLDVLMPGMDGFATCAALRSLPGMERVPVLMLTGLDDAASVKRAYQAGATDFVTKPIAWSVLPYKIHGIIGVNATYEKLAQSQLHLAQAQRMARLGYWDWDVDHDAVNRSDELLQILGKSRGELPARMSAIRPLVHPDDGPLYDKVVEEDVRRGRATSLQYRIRHASGQVVVLDQRSSGVFDATGKLMRVEGTIQDITERKRAEHANANTLARLELALAASNASTFEYNVESGQIVLSASWAAMLGAQPAETRMPLADFLQLAHPDDLPEMQETMRCMVLGQRDECHVLHRVRHRNGQWIRIDCRGKVIRQEGHSRPTLIVGIYRDVTDDFRAQEKLRESQKLEAIGQLTGGLAHDFNNLLGIVLGNLDLMGERLPKDDQEMLHQHRAAVEAAIRGTEVTRALLAVARRQPLEVACYDLNALLADMLSLLRFSAGKEIEVRSQFTAGLLLARLDVGGLCNVVLNLVINARDAMHDQQRERLITLRTRRERVSIAEDETLAPGRYAVMEVEDTGPGMNEQVRALAFDPFFTTKEPGKGTGLGLAMVYSYAAQLGGIARIQTREGAGTTVRVYLPLDPAGVAAAGAAEDARLASLHAHAILDTAPEDEFDALVAEAARVCGVPIALVSLVDETRQWFKAKVGLAACQTPREVAFCAHAIVESNGRLVVPDARADARFSGNPLVNGAPHVRFYAGIALTDANGEALGTLCVIDNQPRQLDARQLIQFEGLAHKAAALIRLRDPRRTAPATPASATPQPAWKTPADTPARQPSRHGKRVLVVDDEPEICELATIWLESLGHTVTTEHSPEAALKRLDSGAYDILFSDIVMPGSMDGIALAEKARQSHPALQVLLTSGYARNLTNTSSLPGHFLNKPYRKNDLARALGKLDEPLRHHAPPAAALLPPTTTGPLALPAEASHPLRVLYVDDDEDIAILFKRMLERLGHRVSIETDPLAALEMLRAHALDFDLVVADQGMPTLNGIDLAKAIRDRFPGLRFAIVTGHVSDALLAAAKKANIGPILAKPAVRADYGALIEKCLA